MKSNFTSEEFNKIKITFSLFFNARINKAGNITLEYKDNPNDKFTFYRPSFKNGEIIIRRIHKTGGYYGGTTTYPLNMKRGLQKKTSWGYTSGSYDINDSYFPSVDEAIEYFSKYFIKYKIKDLNFLQK